ncbi:MAG: SagB/ThcOx family dehydrogenase [Candidatus Zixiibacteriota bacterium]
MSRGCLSLPLKPFVLLTACLLVGGTISSAAADEGVLVNQSDQGAGRVRLPMVTLGTMTVEEAIARRHSVRAFSDRPLSLAHVGHMLQSAYGITQQRGGIGHRGVPSAGGFFPLELYVVVARVDSLAPGLYHFNAADTSLESIQAGDFRERLHRAANSQDALASPSATILICAHYERTTARYAARGRRYIDMEVGAVCQNIYLQATALGLGTCAVGAFDDEAANRLLDLDGKNEAVLLLMPVGHPAGM